MNLQTIERDHFKAVDRYGNYIRFDRNEAKELVSKLKKELSVVYFTLSNSPACCDRCKSLSLDEIGEAPGIATLFKCRECEHEFYL